MWSHVITQKHPYWINDGQRVALSAGYMKEYFVLPDNGTMIVRRVFETGLVAYLNRATTSHCTLGYTTEDINNPHSTPHYSHDRMMVSIDVHSFVAHLLDGIDTESQEWSYFVHVLDCDEEGLYAALKDAAGFVSRASAALRSLPR